MNQESRPINSALELYADLDETHRARRKPDREIEEFLAGIAPERLDAPFSYENYAGQKFTRPLGPAIVHLLNHQTHLTVSPTICPAPTSSFMQRFTNVVQYSKIPKVLLALRAAVSAT